MARNDGADRTCVRNVDISDANISNTQAHNEREKSSYVNPDIVQERTPLNVHFKVPTDGYTEMFDQMQAEKIISTRGLKPDATKYCELVFDVNSAYFYNHSGYEFAKQFYEEAYRAAVKIVGGEQYILSAVMHADERNRAMSEQLGQDVYHYHMHVVYIPVVEKEILWSKRCKDPALRGTVKEVITQVSRSKKWMSKPAVNEAGDPILNSNGKPVLRKSYSVLQDDFYQHMISAGYTDLQRGERGSSEEHLTVTQFKVRAESERLEQVQATIADLQEQKTEAQAETKAAKERLNEVAPVLKEIEKYAEEYTMDADKVLPAADRLESARSYREKKAMPLFRNIIKVLRGLYRRYLDMKHTYTRIENLYHSAQRKIKELESDIGVMSQEKEHLNMKLYNYNALCRGCGEEVINAKVKSVLDREEKQAREERERIRRERESRRQVRRQRDIWER